MFVTRKITGKLTIRVAVTADEFALATKAHNQHPPITFGAR